MKKFEFNEVTYASIYQLYNIDNEMDMNSATILLKKGLILKFIKMFVHSKPMFINSNFTFFASSYS